MRIIRGGVLVIGTLFLLIGFILSFSYFYSENRIKISTDFVSTNLHSEDKYTVSGFFNKSEKLIVRLPELKTNPILVPFNASIFDPYGNETLFYIEFVGDPVLNVEYEYTVLKNDAGLELVEGIFGGIATYSGNYTVRLDRLARLLFGDPPNVFYLYKETQSSYVAYPYQHQFVLYSGLTIVSIGSVMSIWAFKPKKTVIAQKRLKNKK